MPAYVASLKQKLSDLSLPQSTKSSDTSSWPLRGERSKQILTKFALPWARQPQLAIAHGDGEWEKVQDVMTRFIFQAGVDFETRPMVVVSASALPDPNEVNYDLLLSRILTYLNLYVESDYTVVLFAAGGGHTPPRNWIWKAYRGLSRKYRKNLKQLYVVHSSFFTKMLLSLAGAIISPKFFRKIIHTSTLSELARHVPLTQIDIPPAVYRENLKFEGEITLPVPTRSSIFGVPLEELMGYNGEKGGIPRVVKDSIQFLRDSGLEEEGLFRRSPSSTMLRAAKDAYDRGNIVSLDKFGDPFLAAVLIKKYLRDLPQSVIHEKLYPIIRRCPQPTSNLSDMTTVTYIRDVFLPELVPCAYILLRNILHLMHDISLRSHVNKMDARNLTIVLCPNLVRSANPMRDVQMCAIQSVSSVPSSNEVTGLDSTSAIVSQRKSHEDRDKTTLGMVIELCIERYYEIFDDAADPVASPSHVWTLSGQTPGVSSNSLGPIVTPGPGPRSILPTHLTVAEGEGEGDEDIDDTMLVMPIEPGSSLGKHNSNTQVSWAEGVQGSRLSRIPPATTSEQESPLSTRVGNIQILNSRSSDSDLSSPIHPSTHTPSVNDTTPYPTFSKARSFFSNQGGSRTIGGTNSARSSISVGKGTVKKSIGSRVEAMGITAEGFFALPGVSPSQANGASSAS